MTLHPRLRQLEWCLLGTGVACVLFFGAARLNAHAAQARAMASLTEQEAAAARAGAHPSLGLDAPKPTCPSSVAPGAVIPAGAVPGVSMRAMPVPDMRDWDPVRRTSHARALAAMPDDAPRGRLDIPGIKLAVAVLPGIDALSLNGGVGHIPGTPSPGEPGNVGIAGHRDGFFRGLEHVTKGDVMRLTTPRGSFEYRVEWTRIVDPIDVHVLARTEADALTLVTCYPFRYVGSAPRRFIVRATCAGAAPEAVEANAMAHATATPESAAP